MFYKMPLPLVTRFLFLRYGMTIEVQERAKETTKEIL